MSKVFNFQLQRYSEDGFSTLGIFHEIKVMTDPLFMGYTLEDEKRFKKVKGDTRIAARTYEIGLMKSLTPLTIKYREDKRFKPFFTWHLWLMNVPDFTGVYIHVGNDDGDTDGCILMGDSANNNQVLPGNDGWLQSSGDCYSRFYKYLTPELEQGNRAFLTIRDEMDLIR